MGALAAAAEEEGPDLSLLVVLTLVLPDAPDLRRPNAPGPDPALAPDPARLPGAGLVQSGDPNPALWLGAAPNLELHLRSRAGLPLEAPQEVRVQSETDAPAVLLQAPQFVYCSTFKVIIKDVSSIVRKLQ